jgi:hypothetical protein
VEWLEVGIDEFLTVLRWKEDALTYLQVTCMLWPGGIENNHEN